MKSAIYLDDIIIARYNMEEAQLSTKKLIVHLEKLKFTINTRKPITITKQIMEFIQIEINSI